MDIHAEVVHKNQIGFLASQQNRCFVVDIHKTLGIVLGATRRSLMFTPRSHNLVSRRIAMHVLELVFTC